MSYSWVSANMVITQNTDFSCMRMLLPMELRACREADAQLQYTPFRTTVFSDRGDDLAASRGPGALFREEWNSLAGNAQRHKSLSLYCMERDVNPTSTTTVQRFYNAHEASDLGSQLTKKGNAVASLKSSVPRFHGSFESSTRGPGSYFPDRYHGAFPALFDKITPSTVRLEKLKAKRDLAATFGIVPAPNAPVARPVANLPLRISPRINARTLTEFPDIPLETTQLAPALTPRNAYQNTANRQFILSLRPQESEGSSQ